MKKLIYIIITSCLLLGIGSCDQDIDYPYEGKDRIYFQCFTFNSYTRIRTYRSMTQSGSIRPKLSWSIPDAHRMWKGFTM